MGSQNPVPIRSFMSDNIAGASPEVVRAIVDASSGHVSPYGNDPITKAAHQKLQDLFECEVDVFAVSSGTAANCIGLASLVRPWGSILCHPDSHINNDECGAPEAFTDGAKLITVPGKNGKLDPHALRAAVGRKAGDVHSVQPSVVSISQATENGGVYTIDQIQELSKIAKAAVDLIVSFDTSLKLELSFRQKRAGQLGSKMRFHTAQIEALLKDDLWLRNARHANSLALRLAAGIRTISGAEVLNEPSANILFCRIAPHVTKGLLARGYQFYHDRWEPGTVRFVTSFSHSTSSVDELVEATRSCYA